MSFNEIDRAHVLAEALPYIQKYTGKTIVVKYGGNAMISQELRQAVISDIILLSLVGVRVVVVHGGGPEISQMLKKIGTAARQEIEQMLEMKVNLSLFVKVRKDWRDSDNLLRNFGYNPRDISNDV